MNNPTLMQFDDVEDLLAEHESDVSASEFQGVVCGFFAGGMKIEPRAWQQPLTQFITEGQPLSNDAMEQIDHYVAAIGNQLETDIFELEMMLPPEVASISERLESISDWVQGFLYGYGVQMQGQQINSDDLNEALEDLLEIAKVELEVEETEEMETALNTVEEHVRVSSQVVYLETRGRIQQAVSELSKNQDSLH